MSQCMKEQWKDVKPKLYKHKGVHFIENNVDEATLNRMPDWEARSDDVFVVTYPKAGKEKRQHGKRLV